MGNSGFWAAGFWRSGLWVPQLNRYDLIDTSSSSDSTKQSY